MLARLIDWRLAGWPSGATLAKTGCLRQIGGWLVPSGATFAKTSQLEPAPSPLHLPLYLYQQNQPPTKFAHLHSTLPFHFNFNLTMENVGEARGENNEQVRGAQSLFPLPNLGFCPNKGGEGV